MTTVTRYPTTNAVGVTGFTNPGNAYASDDSYATAAPSTLSTISSYFGGFDFASYIPSGATINSVTVYCERKFSTTASAASSTLRPYNLTTALASENENTSEPTTDTEYSVNFGALTITDVRSADFRILVGAKRGSGSTGYTYSLDVVYVTVDYTATTTYTLACDYASLSLTGQDIALSRILNLACSYGSVALTGQDATLVYIKRLACVYASVALTGQTAYLLRTLNLACDYTQIDLSGQAASLLATYTLALAHYEAKLSGQNVTLSRILSLACEYAGIDLTGQDITLEYIQPGLYTLEADHAEITLTGQDVSLSLLITLSCLHAEYTITGGDVTFFVGLWEPSGDMITLGTLLTRIQYALGDPSGTIWDRTTVIWPFAVEAIRDFPILRPSSVVSEISKSTHSFSLPSDFRKVIYVEFPLYQDPPEYLMRKNHLDVGFYDQEGFYDVERDYDADDRGGGYMMFVSNNLVSGDVVTVRYLATHTTEFANEYSYITVENQYVQVLINHVILMCFQERLSKQLQDPTAYSNTIQQCTEAVKKAEAIYLGLLNRAQQDITASERISDWKVDKHDRIY